MNGTGGWNEKGHVPRQIGVRFPDLLDKISGWQIYWHVRCDKAGVFEVDFVARTPNSAPPLPDGSKVMEIFGSRCDHIERVPSLVGTHPGRRHWVFRLTAKKLTIEPLLFAVAPACGCDPWLDSGTSRDVYQCLREWLKLRN